MKEEIDDNIYDEDFEESNSMEWEDYSDFPFAMEVVNGEIISMTEAFQTKVTERLAEKLQISKDELAQYLLNLYEGEEAEDDRFSLISSFEYDALSELLGFNQEENKFDPEGIGFLDSSYGQEAIELLKLLDYKLNENIEYGPHGHGTSGVIFVENDT